MNVLHLFMALMVNKVALQYAICAACVLAPLYTFVLKPVLRWSRYRGCPAPAAQLATPVHPAMGHDTPVRLSTASSTGFLSPHSVAATPLPVTPVFNSPPNVRASRVSTGSAAEDAADAMLPPPPSLEVVGTAVRASAALEAAEYRSPAKRLVSAVRRQVQQRGAAILGSDDDALRSAVDSGEVYFHQAARRLPSQDHLAQRLLRRQQRHALYDELDITESSLEALYASPKFQAWYGANREDLLRDAQLRESFYLWRSLARAVVLLVALVLLPAFSFSTQTNATQWWSTLDSSSGAATVASAPFAQLLLTRMRYIQSARSDEAVASHFLPFASYMRADVRVFAAAAVGMAEWLAVVTAVCALVTSSFMPRGSRRTASVAFVAFSVLLIESMLVPGVSMHVGLGALLIVTVVGTQIRRAAE